MDIENYAKTFEKFSKTSKKGNITKLYIKNSKTADKHPSQTHIINKNEKPVTLTYKLSKVLQLKFHC